MRRGRWWHQPERSSLKAQDTLEKALALAPSLEHRLVNMPELVILVELLHEDSQQ